MTEPKQKLRVFLCYAQSDSRAVKTLYLRLIKDGVEVWFDKEKLLPGKDTEYEIRKAVRESDAVIICLSEQFIKVGNRQKVVRIVFNEQGVRPLGEIFIIPARLEECDVPKRFLRWQYVDLFNKEGKDEYEKLLRSLNQLTGNIEFIGSKPKPELSTAQYETQSKSIEKKVSPPVGEVPDDKRGAFVPKNKYRKIRSPEALIVAAIITAIATILTAIISSPYLPSVLPPITPTITIITPFNTATFMPSLTSLNTSNQTASSTPTSTFTPSITPTKTHMPSRTPSPTATSVPSVPSSTIEVLASLAQILVFVVSLLSFVIMVISYSIALLLKPSNFDKIATFFDQHPVISYLFATLLIATGALNLLRARINIDFKIAIQRVDTLNERLAHSWQELREAIHNNDQSSYKEDVMIFEELASQIEVHNTRKVSLEKRLDSINKKINEWSKR